MDEPRVLGACGAGAAVAIVGGAFGVMVEWKGGCRYRIYMQTALARSCLRSFIMSPPDKNSSVFNTSYVLKWYGFTPQVVMSIKARSVPGVSCNPMSGLT